MMLKKMMVFMGVLWGLVGFVCPLTAGGAEIGQAVYVPIYSHIYIGNREKPFDLAATLSIRNTDLKRNIVLVSADYFDTEGRLIESYLGKEVALAPLAAVRYVVHESDKRGGSGACFVVRWRADGNVSQPVIQGVMIGSKSQQGISFVTEGRTIEE